MNQGQERSTAYRVAFREWFGLRPATADVLVALYCEPVALLKSALLATTAGIRSGAVGWHINQLRTTLENEAIDSERGGGYRLTDEGRAECRAALWTMGEELRRAS